MPKKLDPAIASVLEGFGFGHDAAWDCHGTWVVYHRVLEQIAAKGGIRFEPPMPLETNGAAKSVAICVTGRMGDKAEWSIGEASPANNKNGYPYAMAEKRAKDRVILKLIGLHGLAYSEDEADDFQPPVSQASQTETKRLPSASEADMEKAMLWIGRVKECPTVAHLDGLWKSIDFKTAVGGLPERLKEQVIDACKQQKKDLLAQQEKEAA